jgi:Bacterial Ig-like domain (group 2)
MSSVKSRLQLAGALAALATLALAVSCRGFFVNPTLTSLTVGPTGQSIAPGRTLQMVATGTFDDGSTANVTGKSLWSSSDTSVATVGASSGLVTAAATISNPPGQSTITATDGTVTNTATVSVCPNVTQMTLTANPTSVVHSQIVTFKVMAIFAGISGEQDVTNQVTWNISDTTVLPSITNGVGTTSNAGTVNVNATLCGATSNTVTITVT